MKLKQIALLALLFVGIQLPVKAEQPCRAYTVDRPDDLGYGYEEINNCPVIRGTFSNSDWRVFISAYEPAAYLYRGTNLKNGNSIELIDFDIVGTTNRPQYRFHNGNVTYIVTFRYTDPNTIRLEVHQENRRILNPLLYR
ncbi:MAG: hypothetical protein SVX43_00600 [Cyanobacteriota bacterium]|nr:hypothetical protein [Cyanobacteriota bacterium]